MSTEKPKTARTGRYRLTLTRLKDQSLAGNVLVTDDLIAGVAADHGGERVTLSVLDDAAAIGARALFKRLAADGREALRKAKSAETAEATKKHIEALEALGCHVELSWPEDAGEEATEADAEADEEDALAEAEMHAKEQHRRERL